MKMTTVVRRAENLARRSVGLPPKRSMDSKMNEVFTAVLHGNHGVLCLVQSQQRTGSKYLQGVLAASMGAHTGRGPTFASGFLAEIQGANYPINPGHCHGLSDRRLDTIFSQMPVTQDEFNDVGQKAMILVNLRRALVRADRRFVFTVVRPKRDRLISAFLLKRVGKFDFDDEVALAEAWERFELGNSRTDDAWWQDNVVDRFGVPRAIVDRMLTTDKPWDAYPLENGMYVLVKIDQIDAMLNRYLFHRLSQDEIRQRAGTLGLTYGLHSNNNAHFRGLGEAKTKLLAAIAKLDARKGA